LAVAVAFSPFAVTLITTSQVAARLVDRFGAARITVTGFLVAALGLGALAGIHRDTAYVSGVLPGMALLAAGMSLVFSGSAVLSTTSVSQRQAGLAGGVMNTAMELGPTVGLAVLMSVAATQTDVVQGYAWAFGAAGAVYLVLAFLGTTLTRRGMCAPIIPEYAHD